MSIIFLGSVRNSKERLFLFNLVCRSALIWTKLKSNSKFINLIQFWSGFSVLIG